MSAEKSILGKNGFAQIFITDQYYILFCFKSMVLDIEDEEIEKTSVNSGRSREYTTGLSSGTLSVSGVTTIENTATVVSGLYMLQHRNELHPVQLSYTSQDGTTKGVSFNAIVRKTNISSDITAWSQSSIDFVIIGEVDTGAIITPPGGTPDIFSDYWNTTPGATSVTGTSVVNGYDLIGITLIGVYREGIEYDIVLGTPVNRQAKYTTPAVVFDTALPFAPGEKVFLIFLQ